MDQNHLTSNTLGERTRHIANPNATKQPTVGESASLQAKSALPLWVHQDREGQHEGFTRNVQKMPEFVWFPDNKSSFQTQKYLENFPVTLKSS